MHRDVVGREEHALGRLVVGFLRVQLVGAHAIVGHAQPDLALGHLPGPRLQRQVIERQREGQVDGRIGVRSRVAPGLDHVLRAGHELPGKLVRALVRAAAHAGPRAGIHRHIVHTIGQHRGGGDVVDHVHPAQAPRRRVIALARRLELAPLVKCLHGGRVMVALHRGHGAEGLQDQRVARGRGGRGGRRCGRRGRGRGDRGRRDGNFGGRRQGSGRSGPGRRVRDRCRGHRRGCGVGGTEAGGGKQQQRGGEAAPDQGAQCGLRHARNLHNTKGNSTVARAAGTPNG